MKIVRWGMLVSVIGGTLLFSTGCQAPFKFLSRDRYNELMRLDDINKEQSSLITSLITEKDIAIRDAQAARKLLAAQDELLKSLQRELSAMPKTGPAEESPDLVQTKEGPAVRLAGDVLFASGQASLTPEGEKALQKAVKLVAERPNMLAINGYTDSDPIKHSGWKSNFELSGARALAVLDYLRKQGVAPDRLHFRGYGDQGLILEGGKENKKKSRRVDIVLLNEDAVLDVVKPVAAPAPKKAPVPK